MAEVSWDAKYTIEIENMDIEEVEELRKAIAVHMLGEHFNKDAESMFENIINRCDVIISIDEED